MSSSIAEILPQLSTVNCPTGVNNLKPTDNCQLTTEEVDSLLEEMSSLISPQFKPWYARTFRALGVDKVHELASLAEADGKSPARLFSYLLKKEL